MIVRNKDIHNHILPGVDDGFWDESSSLEAIQIMAEHGCREFIFTPHLNPEIYPDVDESVLREKYRLFAEHIPAEWNVRTSLAAEYMMVEGFERRIVEQPEKLLLHGKDSLLIEMSYYFRSSNLEEVVQTLVASGIRPILAHPERYAYMAEELDDYDRLRDLGCLFQINYLSLTGVYGPESIQILKYLVNKGWCDFFSSDLHSLQQLDHILDGKIRFPLRKFKKIIAG